MTVSFMNLYIYILKKGLVRKNKNFGKLILFTDSLLYARARTHMTIHLFVGKSHYFMLHYRLSHTLYIKALGLCGGDRIVVGFITTCAISAYQH